jgi:hypothetical protein
MISPSKNSPGKWDFPVPIISGVYSREESAPLPGNIKIYSIIKEHILKKSPDTSGSDRQLEQGAWSRGRGAWNVERFVFKRTHH